MAYLPPKKFFKNHVVLQTGIVCGLANLAVLSAIAYTTDHNIVYFAETASIQIEHIAEAAKAAKQAYQIGGIGALAIFGIGAITDYFVTRKKGDKMKDEKLLQKVIEELPEDFWLKSEKELEMEEQGYRLFGNHQEGFNTRTSLRLELLKWDSKCKYQDRVDVDEAYDKRGTMLNDAGSLYIKAPELIIPERAVLRDWETMTDVPYTGEHIDELIEHAKECNEMFENMPYEKSKYFDI